MEKAVTEIEFERRLSFELIMKMLEGLPGIYSTELFEWFIYSSSDLAAKSRRCC